MFTALPLIAFIRWGIASLIITAEMSGTRIRVTIAPIPAVAISIKAWTTFSTVNATETAVTMFMAIEATL